jgi:NTP pyrophosphatase (non-canonical NTP hydrolase)
MLDFNEYQRQAFTTARYPEKGTGSWGAICYTALGLGEAGEVQNKVKKIARDDGGQLTPERKQAIIRELGGNLWYIAALSTEMGITLEEVARTNLDELFGRVERGTIHGSGDDR